MSRPLCAALLAAAACIPPSSAAAQDLPEIVAAGRLRVLGVVLDEGPQFVSRREGDAPGFDVEVLQGFGRLHDVSVEVVPVSGWDALAGALQSGRGDVIAGAYTDTPARRAQIDFTVEVFPTRTVVLTRKPTPAPGTLPALRALKVGTVKGTSLVDALQAHGVPIADAEIPAGGLAAALRSGRVEAGVDGVESALLAIRADPELQLGMFLGRPESLAYGVRKTSPRLRAALDEYLGNLRRSPTWNRLVVKYFGAAAPEILRRARE